MTGSGSSAPAARASGLMHSLRGLVGTVLAIVQTRLELLTTEIEEEVHRAAEILLWSFVAVVAGAIGLMMLGFVVVVFFWDEHRLLAAILVTALFLLTSAITGLVVRAKIRARPNLLEASVAELRSDRESLERQ